MRDYLRLVTSPARKTLPDGKQLRLLTAQEVLEARREAAILAQDGKEQALCSNACLLARALVRRGKPVYRSGQEVLARLSVSRIQALAKTWAEFDRMENPGLTAEKGLVDALKKRWSARRKNASAGVCSAVLGRCRQNRESRI